MALSVEALPELEYVPPAAKARAAVTEMGHDNLSVADANLNGAGLRGTLRVKPSVTCSRSTQAWRTKSRLGGVQAPAGVRKLGAASGWSGNDRLRRLHVPRRDLDFLTCC